MLHYGTVPINNPLSHRTTFRRPMWLPCTRVTGMLGRSSTRRVSQRLSRLTTTSSSASCSGPAGTSSSGHSELIFWTCLKRIYCSPTSRPSQARQHPPAGAWHSLSQRLMLKKLGTCSSLRLIIPPQLLLPFWTDWACAVCLFMCLCVLCVHGV